MRAKLLEGTFRPDVGHSIEREHYVEPKLMGLASGRFDADAGGHPAGHDMRDAGKRAASGAAKFRLSRIQAR